MLLLLNSFDRQIAQQHPQITSRFFIFKLCMVRIYAQLSKYQDFWVVYVPEKENKAIVDFPLSNM